MTTTPAPMSPAPPLPDGVVPAPGARRLGAFLIDAVLITVAYYGITAVALAMGLSSGSIDTLMTMTTVSGLIVIALSAAYLFWIRRILKSKTAKSVPGEIFRDAATVAGLLLALALLSEMVYGSSGFRAGHFRSAMFIAVSSAVLPYLCMMYLADGRHTGLLADAVCGRYCRRRR